MTGEDVPTRVKTCQSAGGFRPQKPPSLPPNTAAKRAADTFVRIGDVYGIWGLVAVTAAMFTLSGFLPTRGSLAVDVAAFALGGAYCLANFWRCREPHCVISGIGWSALAAFTAVEVALGRSLINGYEQLVFLGILVLAVAFEATWRVKTGTNALHRPPTEQRPVEQRAPSKTR